MEKQKNTLAPNITETSSIADILRAVIAKADLEKQLDKLFESLGIEQIG